MTVSVVANVIAINRLRRIRAFQFACMAMLMVGWCVCCTPTAAQQSGPAEIRLRPVAEGFQKPLQILFPPGTHAAMYVVQQDGRIYRLVGQQRNLFLDISDRINASSGEEGLLSMAFEPEFRDGGTLPVGKKCYVNYTAGRPGHTVVAEIPIEMQSGVPTALTSAERRILRIQQPYRNHNGGLLLFGPDRKLYIGTGDGGSAGDPADNAQNPGALLGKLLRIDVTPGRSRPYSIPVDNPFLTRSQFRGEVYALGLRNPWRFSFDKRSGRLYVADVGQNRQEEINLVQAGDNLGWNAMEGELCYPPDSDCRADSFTAPIDVYGRDAGMSITGGYVYRGRELTGWFGHYFFGDYVTGRIWALPLDDATGRAAGAAISIPTETVPDHDLVAGKAGTFSSFGEDQSGELYVTDHSAGRVYRLVSR
ncbi:MAG: PQQ-dependent sugar dehydrogenase [Leptospiraceae bacterium]|nr:PQQ-dependent sugar dehydrogenase [Leptospiraceae bacterium]